MTDPAGAERSDPHARLDGASDLLREPTWRLLTRLSPLERSLLRSPALRRLHFVSHGGAAALATPYGHSRLQHVAGVFALTALLAPDEPDVRAAALLHDVGHAPFSHSLEALPGVDHHRWTAEIVRAEPVAGLLRGDGLDPERVLALAEGEEASVLKNRDGVLHLDHLDSLVRSGRMRGTLPVPPARLAAGLRRDGGYATLDDEGGRAVEALILEEARLHVGALDLGASVLLSEAVGRLVDVGALGLDDLPRMVDAELAALLWRHEATRDEARRLWFEPWRTRVDRVAADVPLPPGARVVAKDRLYLDLPRVRGRSADEEDARRAALAEAGSALLGRYAVTVEAGGAAS